MIGKNSFYKLIGSVLKGILIIALYFIFGITAQAQSHTFSTYSVGTVTSGTSGVSTSLSTSGLTEDYLFYIVTADYVGSGASPAFSNTMNLELSNGSSTMHKSISHANTGALNNSNSTTLTWTGIMSHKYIGGGNLTARFYDDYNTSGPYTSSVTNIVITIYEATTPHVFSTYSAGTVTSGTSGVSTSLNTSGLTQDYLFYVVTADYVGSGASPAFSNTMNLELSNGSSTMHKSISHANTGGLNNSNSTTLTWTGIMSHKYTGGGNLTARFYDDYNTSGPYTSSVTNIVVTIYKATTPNAFSTYSAGTVTSGTTGVSTSLSTSGLTEDYLFYVVSADYVGSGGSPAFSNTMNLELSNGGSTIYKPISHANTGTLNNSNSTTLTWTGVLNQTYTGGGNLTARFYDDYNTSGPYTSSVTNVVVRIYEVSETTLPVDLVSFEAQFNAYKEQVELNWTTASEYNNAYYSIERSEDGLIWEEINVISGNGISQNLNQYNAIDNDPFEGVNYYKLKQTDYDGSFTYSNIQTINNTAFEESVIYPNPTEGVLNIKFNGVNKEKNHNIILIDNLGKAILNLTSNGESVDLSLLDYAPGIYFLILDSGETFKVRKK